MSTIEELRVFADGKWMGRVLRDRQRDRLSFQYEPKWQADPASFPLSLSMPLIAAEHPHQAVEAFLWGLLPDNDATLQRWSEQYQISARNPFKMLWHVGEDCAGAIQFVRPERVEEWSKEPPPAGVDWLTSEQTVERMELLIRDHSAVRAATDTGSFSLAGAQPKTGLFFDPEKNRWGVPYGTTPTTHILKPATGAFDGFVENEHFCLCLARQLGLLAVSSAVHHFGKHPVIVVERYDRVRDGDRMIRIHQEDMCQALACPPQRKYQNQGGPSAANILTVIRDYSSDRAADEHLFIDAQILNWLIGGTDAHAKNYSLLLASSAQVRLAPLYDLSSALPYPQQVDLRRAGLAMKIGGAYKLREIERHQWEKFSKEVRVPTSELLERIRHLANRIPDSARLVAQELHDQGITHPIVARLVEEISARARHCEKVLTAP